MKQREKGGTGTAKLKLRESRGLRPGDTLRVSEAGMIELESGRKAEKRLLKEAKRQRKDGERLAEKLGIPKSGQRAFAEGRPVSRF